jgi:hypothetical protein
MMAESNIFNTWMDNLQNFFGRMGYGEGSSAYRARNDYGGTALDPQNTGEGFGGSDSFVPGGEELFGEKPPYKAPISEQQDFTQVVPIAGAQNVGVQRGSPLQTLLSIIQRRRQGLQGRQGQQGLLQSGFTGRL